MTRRLLSCLVFATVPACVGETETTIDEGVEWTAVEEIRVGADVDQPLTFFRELRVDDDGRIYTFHPRERLLRIHSEDGDLVAAVGGEGEGPGEFRGSGPLGLIGDSVWVLDYSLYRLSYFSPSGELLGADRFDIDLGIGGASDPPRPEGLLNDGRLYWASPSWSSEVATGGITHNTLLLQDSSGEFTDTLVSYPIGRSVLEITNPDRSMRSASYLPQPFNDDPIVVLSPNRNEYLWVDRPADSNTGHFRVRVSEYDGVTVLDVDYPFDPIRIAQSSVDSILDGVAERFASRPADRGPTPALAREWAEASLYRPGHWPAVSAGLLGTDGTIWLKRATRAGPEWICLDREGQLLGTVRLPERFTPLQADRSAVWGQHLDEFDVPSLVRYGLGREGRS